MVDIFLELPDALMQSLEQRAAASGATVEGYARALIEQARPQKARSIDQASAFSDEPIVKAAEIEIECRRLGCQYGWRFITCPQANSASAKLLLIGLNPAGRERHGPAWSQELGSAYRIEAWGNYTAGNAPLQRQVLAMFDLLKLRDADVMSAQYVPFRSATWADLPRPAEAEAFAERLWRWFKPQLAFERIVCIGKDRPGRSVAKLFDARLEGSYPVGWGDVTADRYRLQGGQSLVALPHLSRFAVFGRSASAQALSDLFELPA